MGECFLDVFVVFCGGFEGHGDTVAFAKLASRLERHLSFTFQLCFGPYKVNSDVFICAFIDFFKPVLNAHKRRGTSNIVREQDSMRSPIESTCH